VLPHDHWKYLESRGFDPEFVSKKYKLLYVNFLSKWKFRIIIPYFIYGRLVAYSSRDITDQQEEKYRHANNQDCIVPVKHCLYNIDSVKQDTIVVVEGPTDVWRVGDGCVGLSGVKYTSLQTKLLRKFKRIFVLLDSDAKNISYGLAYELAPLVPDVEVVELNTGDPADLSESSIKELRMEIFGKLT
jgi:DNA primase